ncbi:MAG: hypothetical protein RML56_10210 [Burkholderiales bacterium]|nr:hypothetical protein [Burkholderiales bacterium]
MSRARAEPLARHGGDEFAIALAEKIPRASEAPFVVGGEFAIGTSIRVSLCPREATDAEGRLWNADVALYRAKRSGRRRCLFCGRSPEMPLG